MAKTFGVGVIGMGWMGQVHSRSYHVIKDRFGESGVCPRLVICADDVEARASSARDRFGFERYTTNWKEVIEDAAVEVVNVTVPNAMHLDVVRVAAAAGKHVFCEKPVGCSPAETAQIEHAARQVGVMTGVGYNYRWAPLVQYARQLILDGKLGELTHYRGRFLVGYGSDPRGVLSWRFERELAGLGALGDLMSHVIDMAHMMFGSIKDVVGNHETFIKKRPLPTAGEGTHFSISEGGPKGDVTNEDYVGALVRFTNGAHGTFEVCRVINGKKCEMAFELNGTRGALSWNFERMNELNVYLPDDGGLHDGPVLIQSGPEHPHHAQFNPGPAVGLGYEDLKAIEAYQFSKSVADGEQGEPGFAQALAVADVQAAISRSWETGGWEDVKSLRL